MGPSIKYVRKIFRRTIISNPLIRTCTSAYQGGKNVSLSGNFAYVLNGWPPIQRQQKRSVSDKFLKYFLRIQATIAKYSRITFLLKHAYL